jgi:predicted AlkP superfamily phosphohydrolase/phosphomutase
VKKIVFLLFILIYGCSNTDRPGKLFQNKNKPEHRSKVLILGFDGSTWSTLGRAIDSGLMPNLKNLIQEGVSGPLHTIRPTLTPVIWTSIATGKKPDKHGITGLLVADETTGEMKPISSAERRVKALWNIVSDQNREVSFIRWPVTWPAENVQGVIVSELAYQKNRESLIWPESLTKVLLHHQLDYRLKDIETLTGIDREKYSELDPEWQWKLMVLLKEYNLDIYFHNISKELLSQGQKDLTAIYFYSMDALGHSFFKFNNADTVKPADPDFTKLIPNWCWLYDGFLGEILKLIDPETITVICSDHGMELAKEPQNFLVRSLNDPPKPGENLEKMHLIPGPDYNADPFSIKLQYTLPSGQHVAAPDGIFCIKGPGIKKNTRIDTAGVCDIAPTVLYSLGLPVAEDFDGNVLSDVFTEEFIGAHPLKKIASYEDQDQTAGKPGPGRADYKQEDDQVMDRLRALGYIK